MADVEPVAVRALVARIAASSGFVNSERLCRFLRFTVDSWLAGEGDQIKEYLIGREVFDRGGEYDPRTDPIVRVEARRLRKKLDEYYAAAGRDEPLKLCYEKGSYLPHIVEPEAPVAIEPKNRRQWMLAGAATLAAGVAGLAAWRLRFPKPKIVVIPARWVWKTDDFTQTPLDVDLAERVAAQMANRHGVSVVAWPMVHSEAQKGGKPNEIATRLGSSRSLIIAVRVEASGTRVTAFLIDTAADRKIHVADKEGQDLTTSAQRQQMAAWLAAEAAAAL